MNIKTFLLSAMALVISTSKLQAQTISKDDKILIVYYSKSGNTKVIAEQIKSQTGGDIFEIEPLRAYPEDYKQTTEQAKKEIAEGYKPALKNKVENIGQYDVIFVGSPCWWGTVASPVSSFLSEYDLSGKTVIPFMTHGGSGLGHSVDDIKKMLPNSKIVGENAFWGNLVKTASGRVASWLKGLRNE